MRRDTAAALAAMVALAEGLPSLPNFGPGKGPSHNDRHGKPGFSDRIRRATSLREIETLLDEIYQSGASTKTRRRAEKAAACRRLALHAGDAGEDR